MKPTETTNLDSWELTDTDLIEKSLHGTDLDHLICVTYV